MDSQKEAEQSGLGVVEVLQQVLECLKSSLLGELQQLREKVGVMEEKVDYLVLDRLQQHQEASVG